MTQKSDDLSAGEISALVRVILILSVLLATLWGSDASGLLSLV